MGIFVLPEGYTEIKKIDLQKDTKLAIWLNLGAAAIMIALLCAGGLFAPFSFEIGIEALPRFLLEMLGLVGAIVLYLLAHEGVHGLFIRRYSGKKAHYGFTGLYAYAGSDAYFTKRQYLVIALAPVVILGALLLLLNVFLPMEWFWGIYFIQTINLSGAVGDLYVTALMGKMPADVLTKDTGVAMTMYARTAG